VVEEPLDVLAIERTGQYGVCTRATRGDLAGEWRAPRRPQDPAASQRLKQGGIEELILRRNPNLEGDATAMYIAH